MIMMSGNYGTYGRIELGLDRIYGCNEGQKTKREAKRFDMHLLLTWNLEGVLL